MKNSTIRAIMAAGGVGLLAVSGLAQGGPALAGTTYSFAVGAGTHAHMWVASESTQDGGPCTIVADAAVAQAAPQSNQIDSVVLTVGQLPVDSNRQATITWGATANASHLLVRYVHESGCAATVQTLAPSDHTLTGPNQITYVVFSATEGTVAPRFTIG